MNLDDIHLTYSEDEAPVIEVGADRVATVPELVQAAPDLKKAEHLSLYCNALNHLKYGSDYRLITDPEEYRARYEKKYQAENLKAPFQEGVTRLRDFGHCDTAEIQRPRLDGGAVVFYVEDDFLGIPYRVTGPAPGDSNADAEYEPLPMQPDKK